MVLERTPKHALYPAETATRAIDFHKLCLTAAPVEALLPNRVRQPGYPSL